MENRHVFFYNLGHVYAFSIATWVVDLNIIIQLIPKQASQPYGNDKKLQPVCGTLLASATHASSTGDLPSKT